MMTAGPLFARVVVGNLEDCACEGTYTVVWSTGRVSHYTIGVDQKLTHVESSIAHAADPVNWKEKVNKRDRKRISIQTSKEIIKTIFLIYISYSLYV